MSYIKSTYALRRMRMYIFAYPDSEQDRADKVLCYLKERSLRDRRDGSATLPYSGLTRAELRKSGTCETDWF